MSRLVVEPRVEPPVVRLGGSERAGSALVTRTLWRLGATASTFPGFYRRRDRAAPRADTPQPLPLVTYRRTTARDLAASSSCFTRPRVGQRDALRRTRLTRHEARVALGLLLSSDPAGDNVGLLRRPIGAGIPMAQKHGWTPRFATRRRSSTARTARGSSSC